MASILPLLALGGVVLLLGGKKKSKASTSSSKCPSLVFIKSDSVPTTTVEFLHETGTNSISMPEVAYNEAMAGSRNIVAITKKTLAHIIPGSCLTDESITVHLKDADGDSSQDVELSAPYFFYVFGMEILEDFVGAGIITDGEAAQHAGMLTKWWFDNMGETPVPGQG